MNTLKHKGFIGHFNYYEGHDKFIGELFGSNETIIFQGKDIAELKLDFVTETNEYLTRCKQRGVEPFKKFSGTFNVRVDPGIHRKLDLFATRNNISLNEFVKRVLTNAVK